MLKPASENNLAPFPKHFIIASVILQFLTQRMSYMEILAQSIFLQIK